jgi:hypothetical protein
MRQGDLSNFVTERNMPLPELTWQDWVTSIVCTANDDAACALAAEP